MRLARLWQALENNRHCLLLKQRVTTAVLCPTQLAACSHLHLTGAVTNHSLLITVFGNLGSNTGPSTVLTEEGLQGPLQLSCLEAAVGWGALTLGQQHQGQSQQHQSTRVTRVCHCLLLPFPLFGGLWITRDPELTDMHHALAFWLLLGERPFLLFCQKAPLWNPFSFPTFQKHLQTSSSTCNGTDTSCLCYCRAFDPQSLSQNSSGWWGRGVCLCQSHSASAPPLPQRREACPRRGHLSSHQ